LGDRELLHYETGEVEERLMIDDSRPDDFNALVLQFPSIDIDTAWDMYRAGITVDDIADAMGAQLS
jgi:hypothetical protein